VGQRSVFDRTIEIRHAASATVENGEIEPTFGPAVCGLKGGFKLAFGCGQVFAFFRQTPAPSDPWPEQSLTKLRLGHGPYLASAHDARSLHVKLG